MEQSEPGAPSCDLSHEGSDGVLHEGVAKASLCFRRLSRPFTEEECVSVRLFKVGFLECRGQGETGPAVSVFGKGTKEERGGEPRVLFLDAQYGLHAPATRTTNGNLARSIEVNLRASGSPPRGEVSEAKLASTDVIYGGQDLCIDSVCSNFTYSPSRK